MGRTSLSSHFVRALTLDEALFLNMLEFFYFRGLHLFHRYRFWFPINKLLNYTFFTSAARLQELQAVTQDPCDKLLQMKPKRKVTDNLPNTSSSPSAWVVTTAVFASFLTSGSSSRTSLTTFCCSGQDDSSFYRKSGPQIHCLLQHNSSADNPLDVSSAGLDPYPRTSNDLREIPRGWQQFSLRRRFETSYLGWHCSLRHMYYLTKGRTSQ